MTRRTKNPDIDASDDRTLQGQAPRDTYKIRTTAVSARREWLKKLAPSFPPWAPSTLKTFEIPINQVRSKGSGCRLTTPGAIVSRISRRSFRKARRQRHEDHRAMGSRSRSHGHSNLSQPFLASPLQDTTASCLISSTPSRGTTGRRLRIATVSSLSRRSIVSCRKFRRWEHRKIRKPKGASSS